MSKTVDFYFTPVSPWTYLGMARFRAITAKHGAVVRYKPVDMGPLFASVGVKALKDRPEALKRNRLNDLKRWRTHLGIPLNLEPKFFPTSPVLASKMIVAARQAGEARPSARSAAGGELRAPAGHDIGALADAYLRACWAEERNVGDEATAIAIAEECGFDGRALRRAADSSEVQAEFEANTEEALGRYVWGSPSYYIEDELFFGQDRLEFVERKLAG